MYFLFLAIFFLFDAHKGSSSIMMTTLPTWHSWAFQKPCLEPTVQRNTWFTLLPLQVRHTWRKAPRGNIWLGITGDPAGWHADISSVVSKKKSRLLGFLQFPPLLCARAMTLKALKCCLRHRINHPMTNLQRARVVKVHFGNAVTWRQRKGVHVNTQHSQVVYLENRKFYDTAETRLIFWIIFSSPKRAVCWSWTKPLQAPQHTFEK